MANPEVWRQLKLGGEFEVEEREGKQDKLGGEPKTEPLELKLVPPQLGLPLEIFGE